jgi:hypothetical protein
MYIDNIDNTLSQNPYSAQLQQENNATSSAVNKNPVEQEQQSIHNAAVDLSISMESIKVYLNFKSMEFSKENTNAQSSLLNLINNNELYGFLSGEELENGMSLSSIGYTGKPITSLNPNEAKELVSDEGFFGVEQTSLRVSSFVIGISGDDVEALKESRRGVVQGFEEAEKMWGGKLPDISYETQEKTLSIIDKKIEELTKTDLEKKAEEPS